MARKKLVTVRFGRHPFEADCSKKPMQWYILGSMSGYYLLLSKYCIEWWPFRVRSAVTWENSGSVRPSGHVGPILREARRT